MPRDKRNQLRPQFLSQQNLTAFSGNNSASRKQMAAGNFSQMLPLIKATLRGYVTGTEVEYGEHTFAPRMPATGQIVDVIEDIEGTQRKGGIQHSPNKLVVYEDLSVCNYGCFEVPTYISKHKLFGAPIHPTPESAMLRAGVGFREGTLFGTTSDLHSSGELMFGRKTRIAFITLPGVLEDGIIVSESWAQDSSFYCYESRTFNIGREYYPLDIYGTGKPGDPYKFAPDVGERVAPDGNLAVLRKHRSQWASLDMTRDRMRKPQRIHDRFIRAQPGAEIVNVRVYHDADQTKTNLPTGVANYAEKYDAAKRRRNSRLIELYRKLEKQHDGHVPLTPELHEEIVRALNYNNPYSKPGRRLCYKKDDLDEFRITISFRYKLTAGMAVKATDTNGGKGVVVEVRPDNMMPTDQYGRPLDMVVDPMSLTKRMNLGKVIEPRLSSTQLEYARMLRTELGLPDEDTALTIARSYVEERSVEWRQDWFDRLLKFYELITPRQHEFLKTYGDEDIIEHLSHCVAEGVRPWLPTDNPVVYADIHPKLAAEHPVNKGKMTMRNSRGETITIKDDIMSGDLYMVVLEKLGKDLSAVASAKILANGVPAKQSSSDNGANHTRTNPVRLPSETDLRWMLMAMGGLAVRDLQERGNSPEIHEEIYESILTAENPMKIASVVPRDRLHYNHNRVGRQVRQLQMCNGVKLSDKPTPTIEEVKRARGNR